MTNVILAKALLEQIVFLGEQAEWSLLQTPVLQHESVV